MAMHHTFRAAVLCLLVVLCAGQAACNVNGVCDAKEDCGSCPADCGACPGITVRDDCDAKAYPTIDGTCNNLRFPSWGARGTTVQRMAAPNFADGISEPVQLSPARKISNRVHNSLTFVPSARHLNLFITFFGQMINHDMHATDLDNSAGQVTSATHPADPWMGRLDEIKTNRMVFTPGTGANGKARRPQVRTVTSYLDGSAIYGQEHECTDAMRLGQGGLLREVRFTNGIFPPMSNEHGMEVCDIESPRGVPLAAAGEFRANENPLLFTTHMLFYRNHNYWARRLKYKRAFSMDEQLFQAARAYNRGELQNIAAYEWFPAITGRHLPPYDGYDPRANPAPFAEVIASAFRLGHTMVPERINRYADALGRKPCCGGAISIADAFFDTLDIQGDRCTGRCRMNTNNGLDSLISGMLQDHSGDVDPLVVDQLRNMLFPFMEHPMDLVALNILRNRDIGVASLNEVRKSLGLRPHESFASISTNKHFQFALAEVYESVDEVELFSGGLSEDHLPGGSLGETFTKVLETFFVNLRKADRFWFERVGSLDPVKCRDEAMRKHIYKTTLADIIRRNSGVTVPVTTAFFVLDEESPQPAHPLADD